MQLQKLAKHSCIPTAVKNQLNEYNFKDNAINDIWKIDPLKANLKRKRAEKSLTAPTLIKFTAPSKEERDIWAEEFPTVKLRATEIATQKRCVSSPRPPTETETHACSFSNAATDLMVCFRNFPVPDNELPPSKSLTSRASVWNQLATLTAYSLVKNGYVPDFVTCPPRITFENYQLSDSDLMAARDIITGYIRACVLKETTKDQIWAIAPIFVIDKSNGGHRLIVDLRAINAFVYSLPSRWRPFPLSSVNQKACYTLPLSMYLLHSITFDW